MKRGRPRTSNEVIDLDDDLVILKLRCESDNVPLGFRSVIMQRRLLPVLAGRAVSCGWNGTKIEYKIYADSRHQRLSNFLLLGADEKIPQGLCVRHIGLPNDHRSHMLEVCTHKLNHIDRVCHRDDDDYGIFKNKSGTYFVRLMEDYTWMNFGTYSTIEEARVVRNEAASRRLEWVDAESKMFVSQIQKSNGDCLKPQYTVDEILKIHGLL